MMKLLSLSAVVLASVGACATPTQRVEASVARTVSAEAGEILTAAPGDVIYSETTSPFIWMLTVPTEATIGPYTIDPGDYPLAGVSRRGYFFSAGDGCAGEPAVTAGLFADAAEYLMVPANADQTCIVPAFDHARCGPSIGELRSGREPGGRTSTRLLSYVGPDIGPDGATLIARFTLVHEEQFQVREESLTATVPGVIIAANGRFRVIEADETGVRLMVEQAIAQTPRLERPDLDAAPPAW